MSAPVEVLPRLVAVVHEARRQAAEHRERLAAVRADFEASITPLVEADRAAREQLVLTENVLRETAVAVYRETGSKQPHPGVGIRVGTVLTYRPEEAMAWAMEHKLALQLDTRQFEQIAKTAPLPFVAKRDEPKATIASDLGAVVGETP